MKTEVSPPGPPVCTTLIPGTVLSTSGTVRRCSISMSCAVTTVTVLATCSPGVATDVGLTTRLGPTRAADPAAAEAAGADGGVVTVTAGSSIGGETEICADPVEAQRNATAMKSGVAARVARRRLDN